MYASKSRRVLVVEDEPLLAWELQGLLSGHGYEVIGPIGRLPILLHYLQQTLPDVASDAVMDAALLDVTIDGGLVFAAADMLARAEVPFAFVSSHARQDDSAVAPAPAAAQQADFSGGRARHRRRAD